MTMRLLQAAVLLAAIASPALAQNNVDPRTSIPSAQNSGAGIPGQPGGKNGPAINPQGQSAGSQQANPTTRLQDASKIPGAPGGKSGPAVMPPSRSAQQR